jgi:ankyrin repeat protein
MLAANSAQWDVMALLMEHGANVNARDAEGETALMYDVEALGDNPGTLRM